MAKKIKCPGEKLEYLLDGLSIFERLDEEADAGGEGPGKKKRNLFVGDTIYGEFLKQAGITPEEEYKGLVMNYIARQSLLSELYKYGNTKEEILQKLKEHVETCQNCSNSYLEMLTMSSNGLLKLLKRPTFKKLEGSRKGLFFYLKELDRKYLGLFKD